jgi:hypothetical protein
VSNPTYIVGIDLGTTHSVVAYTRVVDLDTLPPGEAPTIELFAINQVVSPGEIQARPLLPSFLLLPGPHDVPEGALALPWNEGMSWAVGEYARERGAELPHRLVASAKSWLCQTGIDRTQPVLPFDAPEDAPRVSPLEASARYLDQIRNAWNYAMAQDDETQRLEEQEIYLTVPASFDAVARELTVQAAQRAGLYNLTLLEEPQASFYAWIEAQGEAWRNEIAVGQSVLVCDIGGGTSDFSLIQVVEEAGNLELQRVAVGNHILLGGDNMDLTLAYAVRAKLAQQNTKLDNWQFRGLVQNCRKAKETLLSDPEATEAPIVILGRGSSLIGGTIRTALTRQEIETILVQGFFPLVEANEFPQRKVQVGIREMGLAYESDPAIARHLAHFLSQHVGGDPAAGGVAYPSAVLFNGGVMKAEPLRRQVLDLLRNWQSAYGSEDEPLRELAAVDLDRSVGLGAAYYGMARKGRGIRIRAGASRTYYIGVESSMPAVPGIPTPVNALCVVPFGMEEGTSADIRQKEFGLVLGQPAVFQLLASNTRKTDEVGETVEDWNDELEEVTLMETQLSAPPVREGEATDEAVGGALIPVWLQSKVTEIGTLELWCVARNSEQRWKLEFNLREQEPAVETES